MTGLPRSTKLPQRFPIKGSRALGDIIEDGGLDGRQRSDITRHGRKYQRRAYLVGPLYEPDGELRAQRHHRATPGLAGRGIAEVIRLKIVSEIIDVPLRPLVVDIQISWSYEAEQRSDPAPPTLAPLRLIERRVKTDTSSIRGQ